MGSGEILECEPPSHLRLSLGGGADEIEVWLRDAFHEVPELRPAIDRGLADMRALLDADAQG
jgi:hypothetical protein